MNTLVMQRDDLMPRPPGGMGSGLVLALLVHALLVAALAIGVNWHASEPEGIEAELCGDVHPDTGRFREGLLPGERFP